jgi:glycosyltransferase involved in cell wall biosynthesis
MEREEAYRIYALPLRSENTFICSAFEALGSGHQEPARPYREVQLCLRKAVAGGYAAVLLPSNALASKELLQISQSARHLGLHLWIQISLSALRNNYAQAQLQEAIRCSYFHGIQIVVDEDRDPETKFQISAHIKNFAQYEILILGRKGLELEKVAQRFLEFSPRFYFPMHLQIDDLYYKAHEIESLVRKLEKEVPRLKVRPPRGLDIYDPRIPKDLNLEPNLLPQFETEVLEKQILVSVVIPSYNNKEYLSNTVRHLLRQDLARKNFEIIVVDDGSTDQTLDHLKKELLSKEAGEINFKFVYFPRLVSRSMGDARFRAGVARNLGVKQAEGEYLLFLDSDILVPPNYLQDILEKHKEFDVIQGSRYELIPKVSSPKTNIHEIQCARDTYAVDDGYWIRFMQTQNWNQLEHGWKYVCTHSLSLKRSLFHKIGWIRKTFTFYGYEDSDLGFRLWTSGYTFHLNKTKVYHLFHQTARSEFYNSHYRKMQLLRNSARIFYHNTLDSEAFEHCRYLFDHERSPLFSGMEAFQAWRQGKRKTPVSIPLWRFRVLAIRTIAALQLWRLGVLLIRTLGLLNRMTGATRAALAPFGFWRLRVLGIRTVSKVQRISSFLQLWRFRVLFGRLLGRLHFAAGWLESKVAALGIAWRLRVFLQKTIDRMEPWRIRVLFLRLEGQTKKQLSRLGLWRLRVFFERITTGLPLWRLRVALQKGYARLALWRIPMGIQRGISALELWKLKVGWQRALAHLQLWRLRVWSKRQISELQLWRIKVILTNFFSKLQERIPNFQWWHLRVGFQRTLSHWELWRLRVWLQALRGNLNQALRLPGKMLFRSGQIFIALVKSAHFAGIRFYWLGFQLLYPVRKIHYVVKYQIQKRRNLIIATEPD